jgi:hypothetical protein
MVCRHKGLQGLTLLAVQMMRPEITLLRDVAGWPEAGKLPHVLTFQVLKDQIVQGKGFAHILAYRRAKLLTHRFDLLSKPLNTAILLRLFRMKPVLKNGSGHPYLQGSWFNSCQMPFQNTDCFERLVQKWSH